MTTTFEQPLNTFPNFRMEHKQDIGLKEPRRKVSEVEVSAEEDVSFFHDFVAGGVAGSASVVVGHPFDTIKVCGRETLLSGSVFGWFISLTTFRL